ncbi:DEAD/DEAH box helicase [Rhodoplanes elegans]|uniref:DEAD/DEAH box helicase n=1 Tax=Rhodoplanes elegans TaxID=29408 RepID=A0A327KIG0_9BRAD|nr:DEAD/DEAH box helicase [Rhodoplanes elegans]MBK5958631.1 DEAD/DEAH box helicase [Rhodoplanes elegans]RAI37901.1 DEAD/DEAH box helicase [Rhodoplanes elegans]
MTFLPTRPPLARALAARNYDDPTPVQAAVLADDAAGRDLLVSAQTGSGKTVAYGLAIADDLLGDADGFEPGAAPLALVVAPTRELALQVQRELAWLYGHTGARVVSCVGGTDPRREQRELAEGAHIVVGTPGRLCDHLRRHRLDISGLKAVVLDEADEMLDLGFREDLELILETTPDSRRTLLFSATLPRGIVALAREYQKDALRIDVAGDESGHADIEYRAIRVAAHEVEHAVVNLLRYFESPGALVFCNTRNAVRHLQAALLERGFSVVALSGELAQNERTLALQALRDGRARVCVATDVAARGIDLPHLGLVIHAELPNDPAVLQHRSGRTGRAGRKGVSILLVPNARRRRVETMLFQAGIDAVWGSAPQPEEIRRLDLERVLQDARLAEEPSEDDLIWAQALLAQRSPEQLATALARILRAGLPSPEDIVDPGERPSRSRRDRDEAWADRARTHASAQADGSDPGWDPIDARPKRQAGLAGGSVWYRASVGRNKNAEARWLLPMICRRGGIDKRAVGAIRICDSHSEIEIAADAAELFAAAIARPDKESNIRLEPLPDGPQAPSGQLDRPAGRPRPHGGRVRPGDRSRHERGATAHAPSDNGPAAPEKKRFAKKPWRQEAREDKPLREDKPFREGKPPYEGKPFREKKPFRAGKTKPAGARKAARGAVGKPTGKRGRA